MRPFPRPPRATPLWTLALLALLFWGSFNLLQYHAWFGATHDNHARPGGAFQERLPDTDPFPSVYLDSDSLYWLHLATGLLEKGSWRPRQTDWDNVPLGRPHHWSSPLIWLMTGTARLAAFFSDRPATERLDITSPWINPALFVLLLCAFAWLLGRRTDPWTAGLLVLALATLPPVLRSFSVLHIDHHGLVLIPALGMTLCLLLGLTDPASPPRRGWFIASGLLGGIGLWLQASHQLILIAGTLGGLLLWTVCSAPFFPAAKKYLESNLLDPPLWRAWAITGTMTSLVAYAVEYAPAHLGLHLEVNHPLYALVWWGGTESILAIALARRQQRWTPARLAVIALGVLPAMATFLLMRGESHRCFLVASPFLQRIHEHIKEFQPLLSTPHGKNPILLVLLFHSLPFLALLGAGLWASRSLPTRHRMALHLALFPLLPSLLLCLLHTRFSSLLAASLWNMAAALGLSLPQVARPALRRTSTALLAAGCLLGLGIALAPLLNSRLPFMPVDRWVHQVLQRDVARELATLPDFAGSRVLCDYNLAPSLQAFARVQTTGGLYWENIDGLQAATDFFAATRDEEARQLLAKRGIRWVVFENRPGSASTWHYYRTGNTSPTGARSTLAHRLAMPGLAPAWLERIPPDPIPLASQASFQVYRVADESPRPVASGELNGPSGESRPAGSSR